MAQKVIKIGSSVGVVLPKELLEERGIQPGDSVTLVPRGPKEVAIVFDKKASSANERIAKLTTDFIERYRADLEALAGK